ncbi:MAG TPA: alpha/beta hydrolase [Blastocatellia bacterium]|nr:alpha/beta hydrolase [Blastocatellia bacterium]
MRKLYCVAAIGLAFAVLSVFPARPALASTLLVRGSVAARANQPTSQGSAVADKWATVFGVKIHYLEAGSGPDVILLHGLGGDASNWASTIGPLSQKYHVIVPDQVGFGKSDKPVIPYRVGTLVDFLDSFMSVLKISKASLVGNSLGGWTAAAFALAHPDKVDRLVLVDAAGFSLEKGVDPHVLNGLNPSTREGVKQLMSLVVYNKAMFDNPATLDLLFARKMATGDGYTIQQFINSIINGEDVLDNTVSGIKQPTLIVWGKQDMLVPLATGERYHKSISGSELLVFDKCGHVPMLEQANQFNSGLMKFLAGEQPEGLSQ